MLRDDMLVVIEEVIARCEDAAEDYVTAAKEVESRDLAALFRFLEAERRQMAWKLSEALRHRGQPAHERDHSQSGMHRWMTRLRAAFTIDRRIVMLEECERSEQHLGEAMARALGAPLSGDARRLLIFFEADVTATRGRLQAIRTRIKSS